MAPEIQVLVAAWTQYLQVVEDPVALEVSALLNELTLQGSTTGTLIQERQEVWQLPENFQRTLVEDI